MKITSIKQQIKRQGRYSIYVEGKYCFSLSETALLESKLINGQDLTESEVGDLKQKSADDKLYGQALNYALIRPRSTWEMTTYLKRKNCPPSLSDLILNKLSKLGYLNDEDFARSWVTSRRLLKPTSLRRLDQELRLKHVPREVIERVLNEEDVDSEQSALKQLIERKRRQQRYKDNQKLMQYLSSQGFGYGDIKDALSELEETS